MSSKLNLAAEFTKDLTTARGTDYYLLNDLLNDQEREIRDWVRSFVDAEVLPIINDYWERAEFPFELVPKLATLGIVGGAIEGHGCPGLSRLAQGMVTLELSRGDGGVNTFIGVQTGLAMGSINLLGSDGAEAALAAGHGDAREDRCLRADRAAPRIRFGRAGDQRAPQRRPLGAQRHQTLDRQRQHRPCRHRVGAGRGRRQGQGIRH
jgi:hypothetical protein